MTEVVHSRALLVRLGDLGRWRGGGTPSKANPDFWTNGTVPWVSPKDMKTLRIGQSEDQITESAIQNSSASLVTAPSVAVVTRSGILQRTLPVSIVEVDAAFNQDMKVLQPRVDVLPEYVAYCLRGHERQILTACSKHGTTVASIDFARFQNFTIPLPATIDEQRAIVEAIETQFTRLDDAVAALQRTRTRLKRYRASVLKAAFEGRLVPTEAELARQDGREYEPASVLLERINAEREAAPGKKRGRGRARADMESAPTEDRGPLPEGWAWTTIEDIADSVTYGSSAKTSEVSGVPVLRMGNILDGALNLASLKYLPPDHSEFPSLLLQPLDVLFNRTNSAELVGKTAVYPGMPDPCSFASYLIRVRLIHPPLGKYISAYINSVYGRSWIKSVVSQQVGQANVNGTKLRALTIPIPPTKELNRIVTELERISSLIDQMETTVEVNLKRAESLRQAILRQAFCGRLINAIESELQ